MSDAQIIYLPRLDLPTPPTHNPAYYIEGEEIRGLGSIWMQTPQDTWWNQQQPMPKSKVPANLRQLGVIT